MSSRELTQRSRSAKCLPAARHRSFDFGDAPTMSALHRVLMRVKWDGAIREARRKSKRAEMRIVNRGTSQHARLWAQAQKGRRVTSCLYKQ